MLGGVLRGGGAILGSVFFRSQHWRLPAAGECAELQLFFSLSGWSPHVKCPENGLFMYSSSCAIPQ